MSDHDFQHYFDTGFPMFVCLLLATLVFLAVVGMHMEASGEAFGAAVVSVIVGGLTVIGIIVAGLVSIVAISGALGYIATDLRQDIREWRGQ